MILKIIPLILALTCAIVARPQDDLYDYEDYDAPACSSFADRQEPELNFR